MNAEGIGIPSLAEESEQLSAEYEPNVVGFVEEIAAGFVYGWASNTQSDDHALEIFVSVDGEASFTVKCDGDRPDVLSHGYRNRKCGFAIPLLQSLHSNRKVVVSFRSKSGLEMPFTLVDGTRPPQWEIRATSSDESLLTNPQLIGFIEYIGDSGLHGWLIDNRKESPARIKLFVDSIYAATIDCDQTRDDVASHYSGRSKVGFKYSFPLRLFDDSRHVCEFFDENDQLIGFMDTEGKPQRFWTVMLSRFKLLGQIDGMRDGAVRGWIIIEDRKFGRKISNNRLLVSIGLNPVAHIDADVMRPDVAAAYDCDPRCGLIYVPPPRLCIGRSVTISFMVEPYGIPIPGSPLKVDFLEGESYAKLRILLREVEETFTKIWQIRTSIKDLLPANSYSLISYNEWSTAYYELLDRDKLLVPSAKFQPLISIICPTYKPRLSDFEAAIQSVIRQTYDKWELIIVDDASNSEAHAAAITKFADADSRIKFRLLEKNRGISGATNAAIEMASGAYIALFDHDDVLEQRALDVVVSTLASTGAKLVYCDEDKLEESGKYSEIHFKTKWNYRLLLAQNYVCHFLVVERSALMAAGLLRSKYDGAQDHELILRLSETLPSREIHHISEVLYHWRKTPFSTASSGASKAYAVNAGVAAIHDHLVRRGADASISTPLASTLYRIKWNYEYKERVTIIVPYRDHIGMTEDCVTSVFARTSGVQVHIILVDNWSQSHEAAEFAARWKSDPRITYVRAEEEFNYSKLNNDAVKLSATEFVVFLNNDIFITHNDWLNVMLGEALFDRDVAIVGAKLLYPNGMVQHGGVVLGVGGIADHAHRNLTVDEPGYMGRAICAQEISAVTAACMLCRRSAFDEVGGFDERELAVAYNDVDLCLRIGRAGHKIVWAPDAVAEHRESMSRGNDLHPDKQVRFFHEHEVMQKRWGSLIAKDPFYSRHFSRRSGIYLDLADPEVGTPK